MQDAGLTDTIDFVPHLPYWQVLTYLSLQNAVVFDLLGQAGTEAFKTVSKLVR